MVSNDIWNDISQQKFGVNISRVGDQTDRFGDLLFNGFFDLGHRVFKVVSHNVNIANFESFLRPIWVNLNHQRDTFVHRHSQGLGAAHPTQTSGEDKFAFQ